MDPTRVHDAQLSPLADTSPLRSRIAMRRAEQMRLRFRNTRAHSWDLRQPPPEITRVRDASRLRFSCTSDAGRADKDRTLRDFAVAERGSRRAGDRAEALR